MGKRARGEGTVFQRKDGRWVAQANLGWVGGRRSRPTFYGRTQAEARAKLEAAKRAVAEGRPAGDSRDRLVDFLSYWLDEVIDPSTRAPATKAGYRHMTDRHVVPALGHVRLADLRPKDVQALLNAMRTDGFSDRTRQYVHAVLRLALGHAERWGLIGKNPARLVQAPRPKRDPERVHALDIEDARRLLEAARQDRLFALYALVLLLGLRRGEALGLRWCDIDFLTGTLRVEQTVTRVKGYGLVVGPPKSASSRRTLFLPPACLEALQRHLIRQEEERLAVANRWKDHNLVFPTRVGTPMEPSALNRNLHALCRAAGLPAERLHNLRHSAATIMLGHGGADLTMVKDTLGHSTITVTADLYVHGVPSLKRAVANQMGDVLLGLGPREPLAS